MTARWQDVRCARIPVGGLPVLADLRREPGIRVAIEGGEAWVCWEDGPEGSSTRAILVDRLQPLVGAEVFVRRGGRWYRPGESLPAFHVPIGDGSGGVPLDRAIVPEPLSARRPGGEAPRAVPLRLVRDEGGLPRPATALRCRLSALVRWADGAPSAWIEALSGAWWTPPGRVAVEAEVLVLGPDAHLPALAEGRRYWGEDVLTPMGCRAEPALAERALRSAVGAGAEDLLVLDAEGPELVPRAAIRALGRASLRMALDVAPAPAAGGRRP